MSYLNPLLLYDKKPTYLKAIKAMCAHCVGCTREHLEPGFRDDIRGCVAKDCPLWQFRPYQKKEEKDAD
jgi:hypothetical protein